ncbi:DNA/RNA non-specific endonuclease [Xylanibacter ruminicola]|uniref:Endonuclease G n=1 Tax=Xylanibacter ruminicola TaxID=839 RepID=A0A1M6UDY5_XYLRU|nr:DNA/RNA non-specific endonuclease [Xylanibacter ruminicola]SHK67381.1 endonuclease G [Xylanibacter ruminicola]
MEWLSSFSKYLFITLILCAQYSCDQEKHIEKPAPLRECNEIVLKRISYIVSYNSETKIPNWVAWCLTAEHVDGNLKRIGGYQEDKDVPIPRAKKEDYKNTKWSHGHMCPAGDNKWDEIAMRESNLLTNICPQDRSLNSGLWNKIEQDCRKWAKKYGCVYIVCGPVLLKREHETIGENRIVVPEAFFKVILRMKPQPAAIGFVVRNNEGYKKRDQFINTVDDVERITGIDFFPALPDDIENVVEAYSDINDWK